MCQVPDTVPYDAEKAQYRTAPYRTAGGGGNRVLLTAKIPRKLYSTIPCRTVLSICRIPSTDAIPRKSFTVPFFLFLNNVTENTPGSFVPFPLTIAAWVLKYHIIKRSRDYFVLGRNA